MSLIADSLKKALKEKTTPKESPEGEKSRRVSLIADILKKALKEKSSKNPGINLLKNLKQESKSSSKSFDPKEVKRFVVLIVIPASVLVFLLVANPFKPKVKLAPQPPVVANAPSPTVPKATKPVMKKEIKPPPTQPAKPSKPISKPVAAKKKPASVAKKPLAEKPVAKKVAPEKPVTKKAAAGKPEQIPILEPGMKEVFVKELAAPKKKIAPPKPEQMARVELKEPPDSPPAPVKLDPEAA
ncbi:MAG: hypothetical protein VW455_00050 [Nitrospinota bacterium]